MKTKMFSTLTAAAICACACIGASPAPTMAATQDTDTVTIGVPKDMYDLNILTDTEYSYENQWVYTMIYDRLFSIGNNGKFAPELATECIADVNGYAFDIYNDFEFYFDANDSSTWPRMSKRSNLYFPYPAWFADFGGYPDDLDGYFFERGDGSPLVLRFTLRDDVLCADYDLLTAEKIKDYIELCQARPSDTVLNRIWSHVYDVQVHDDFVFELSFDLSDYSYGLMDFLYELASPYGSILDLNLEDDNGKPDFVEGNNGTGAYYIADRQYGCITLEKNQYWWGEIPYMDTTPIVRFSYTTPKLHIDDADILYVADYLRDVYDLWSGVYNFSDIQMVASDPLVLLFNPESENLAQVEMRQALTLTADNNSVNGVLQGNILESSNGYWGITGVNRDMAKALDFLNEAENYIGYIDSMELNIIYYDDELGYTGYAAEAIRNEMVQLDSRITVSMTKLTEQQYRDAVQSGNYDMALSFIDLNDLDSVYKTFYPTINDSLNAHLDSAISSAALGTYRAMQSDCQYLALQNHLLVNYGWKAEVFLAKRGISGVNYASFYPTPNWKIPQKYALSDANLVDFRWVTKEA